LTANDPGLQPVLLRPQEIPRFVAYGSLDCGLSGLDWICEVFEDEAWEEHLTMLADPCYWKKILRSVRWALAVKKGGPYGSVQDLQRVGDVESSPMQL
jgi:ATP phosphoribosyltransferase